MKKFFILGNPRSGTTLLRLLLNNHSKVVIPPECGFVVWWHKKYKDWSFQDSENPQKVDSFLNDFFNSKKIETFSLSREKLRKIILDSTPSEYSSLCSIIYENYAKSKGCESAEIWGDKNNFYITKIDELACIFEQTVFVHIIRDGRDVACSYKELNRKNIQSLYRPILPNDIEEIALEWHYNNMFVERYKKQHNNIVTIRYEDLVTRPTVTLTKVCDFIGVEYEREMFDYYLSEKSRECYTEPRDFLQWKGNILNPINDRSINRYCHELNSLEIKKFNLICEKLLKKYDYPV